FLPPVYPSRCIVSDGKTRNPYRKHGTVFADLFRFTLHGNGPTVEFDQRFAVSQSEAGSPGAIRLTLTERVENMGEVFRGNARSTINHFNHDPWSVLLFGTHMHIDMPAISREFECIRQEVVQYFFQFI